MMNDKPEAGRDSSYLRDGERRTVSILFSDMQGFSSLSELLDPEEVDGLMNTIFSSYEEIVKRHDGMVEKYIGDALVAVFGVPRVHEDDPQRAVSAALDFQEEIKQINQSLKPRNLKLSFRTAVHTGLITTGKRGDYHVVTGHAMSVASRLESQASENGILISRDTQEKCENDFLFSPPRTVSIKGSNREITVYDVFERRPYPHEAVFVGRENELQQLTSRYMKHKHSGLSGIILTGSTGIGKTALIGKFLNQLRNFPDFQAPILYARARRFRIRSFGVISDGIETHCGLTHGLSDEEISERLRENIPGIDEDDLQTFLHFYRNPETEKNNSLFPLFCRILGIIISENRFRPYSSIICIDDATCIDRGSLEVFQYISANHELHPFYLLADRSVSSELTESFPFCEITALPPFTTAEAEALIEELYTIEPHAMLQKRIIEACSGNPLFLREYVRFIHEHPDSPDVPSTMQNVFLAAIDQFPSEKRDLLKKLTVFALNFTKEEVEFLHGHTEGSAETVAEALQDFQNKDFIVRSGKQFHFKHEAFKRAIYDSMLLYNRRILHNVIAEYMLASENPHTMRLLHHLIRGESYAQAARVVLQAAERFVNPEITGPIDSILHSETELSAEDRCGLLFIKSAVLFNNGLTIPAEESLREIIALAVEQRRTENLATAYHLLTAYHLKNYEFSKAYHTGKKALSYYGKQDDAHKQNVLNQLATSELLRNHRDAASYLIEEMSSLPNGRESQIRNARTEHALLLGDYSTAIRLIQPEKIFNEPDSEVITYSMLLAASACWQRCDYEHLVELIPGMMQNPSRNYCALSQAQAYLAAAQHYLDNDKASAIALEQAELYLYRITNIYDSIDALRSLTQACMRMQKLETAEKYATRGIESGLHYSAHYPSFTMLMALVEINCMRNTQSDASFFLREAEFIHDQGLLLQRKDLILYHGFAARVSGRKNTMHPRILKSLIMEEQEGINSPELFERWLSIRSYGTIAEGNED